MKLAFAAEQHAAPNVRVLWLAALVAVLEAEALAALSHVAQRRALTGVRGGDGAPEPDVLPVCTPLPLCSLPLVLQFPHGRGLDVRRRSQVRAGRCHHLVAVEAGVRVLLALPEPQLARLLAAARVTGAMIVVQLLVIEAHTTLVRHAILSALVRAAQVDGLESADAPPVAAARALARHLPRLGAGHLRDTLPAAVAIRRLATNGPRRSAVGVPEIHVAVTQAVAVDTLCLGRAVGALLRRPRGTLEARLRHKL